MLAVKCSMGGPPEATHSYPLSYFLPLPFPRPLHPKTNTVDAGWLPSLYAPLSTEHRKGLGLD